MSCADAYRWARDMEVFCERSDDCCVRIAILRAFNDGYCICSVRLDTDMLLMRAGFCMNDDAHQGRRITRRKILSSWARYSGSRATWMRLGRTDVKIMSATIGMR